MSSGVIELTVTDDRVPLARRAKAFSANEQGWGMMIGVIEQSVTSADGETARPAHR